MSYKGEILFPVLVDYPESKFGGFLAVTDYKDPVILDEIKNNGWALWPPISYSYDTINKDYPGRKGQDERVPRLSGAAAMGLERAAVRGAARADRALPGDRQHATGWGSTTRAATWSRASSTAFASRCCSG